MLGACACYGGSIVRLLMLCAVLITSACMRGFSSPTPAVSNNCESFQSSASSRPSLAIPVVQHSCTNQHYSPATQIISPYEVGCMHSMSVSMPAPLPSNMMYP